MTDEIRRTFVATLNRAGADQRTLGGLCVPYNRPTRVSDDGLTTYEEMFSPGAFARQLAAPNRLALKYAHGLGIMDTVGRATQLDDSDDGLHGMFRVFDGLVGDQALTLVDEGLLVGLSVSGVPLKSVQRDGVTIRQRVHLTEISLCEEPAYAEALVSVRRSAPSRDALGLPDRPNDEQLARLAAIGIVVTLR